MPRALPPCASGYKALVDWDQKYATAGPQHLFGAQPNVYLRQFMHESGRGIRSALALADGDGRNGTWLAQQGCRVMAVDISAEGTRCAQAYDRAQGVCVERIVADLATWIPPFGQRWQLLCLFYLHCEAEIRRTALQRAWAQIELGGWIVIEGFAQEQRHMPGRGGPRDIDLLYDPEQLCAELPAVNWHEARCVCLDLNEGSAHQGRCAVVRMLGQRAA